MPAVRLIEPAAVDATAFPFVCFLQCFYEKNPSQRFIGSGCFITPRAILTAGHVVFDPVFGRALSIFATFGGGPRVTVKATSADTTREWVQEQQDRRTAGNPLSLFDIGLVLLQQDASGINPLVTESLTDAQLHGLELNVAGYPASPPGGFAEGTLFGARSFATPHGERLLYPINSSAGTSGGPVWSINAGGQRVIRAVHTSFVGGQGSALRINPILEPLINDWKTRFA